MPRRGRPARLASRYGRDFADWLESKLADLRAVRAEPGLSNSEAARLLGVDHALVSRFLAAKQLPSRATVRRLAVALADVGLLGTVAEIESLVEASAAEDNNSQSARTSGIQAAGEGPAPPVAITRPAVVYYGPHGEIDGADGLTDEESASVLASIAAFRARRARRGERDAAGDQPGVGAAG